nr:PEP-CTERM system TPR-repeat protein PrsT [Dechloromonas sp.]
MGKFSESNIGVPLARNLSGRGGLTFIVLSCSLLFGCSNSASDFVKEGATYLEKGDLTAAVISFKNAVQADPKSIDARLALAEALERNGDLPGAEQQLRRALESGGKADDLLPRIAVLLLDRGENALLIRDFGSQKLTSPNADSDLKALVALAHLASGQPKRATEQLEKVSEQTPAVRLARAQIDYGANRRADAAAEMDSVLASQKSPWWVARAASRVFIANGEAPKALLAIKQSYDAAPLHRGVIGEYAEQLIAANRKEEARPLRDKLRKLAPAYYRTQYLDALFLLEDGKQDQAYTAVTKVLAALPEHTPSQIIAASIELERNELSSVDTRIKKVLSAEPNSSQGYRLRAMLEMRRGNFAEASDALLKAIDRAPEDRNLLAMAAGVAWSRGDKRTALMQMSKAAMREPLRADLLAGYAEMLQVNGQVAEATKVLESGISVAKDAKGREAVFNAALRMKQLAKAKSIAQSEIGLRPKDPEPLLWMAAVLGSEGDDAGALNSTHQALDLRPDYYQALTALAKTATTPERKTDYESRLQKALDLGSKDARVYLDQARVLRGANAGSEKIGAVLDKGVAASPTDVALREAAIRHWLGVKRKDKALALAKDGETAMPDSAPMLALAANVQEAAGEPSQAAVKFAQLSERYPDRVDWNLKHAQNLRAAGKKADAVKVLRRLIQERPEEPLPYQSLVILQIEMGAFGDAQTTAEMLRDKPRMKGPGLLLLGDVYAAANKSNEAMKAFNAAADAGLGELALERKVKLLDQGGSSATASAQIAKWLAEHPNSVAALSLAARRASARQDYPAAAKYLESIVKIDPKNPVALNDLAWAYVMAKDPRALAVAKQAVDAAPNNPNVLDTLSQAQFNAGQKSEAVATASLALAQDAKSPVVRLHLAEFAVESGNKKEAEELLSGLDEKLLDSEAVLRLKALKAKI